MRLDDRSSPRFLIALLWVARTFFQHLQSVQYASRYSIFLTSASNARLFNDPEIVGKMENCVNVCLESGETQRDKKLGVTNSSSQWNAGAMMMQPHILVVEDDPGIATLVERALKQNGFKISLAHDGRTMDRVLQDNRVDLILLDLMLPGEDGLSITRRIRTECRLPIIMLTAMGEETDRIVGLEVGADDYVVKPFSSRELIARIRAVLRRASANDQPRPVKDVTFAFERWRLHCLQRELYNPHGVRIELTSAEFQLLQILCESPRQVLSRESLLRLTQGRISTVDDRSIDTLISRIRRKIESDAKNPTLIKTIRLGGYMFTPEVNTQ